MKTTGWMHIACRAGACMAMACVLTTATATRAADGTTLAHGDSCFREYLKLLEISHLVLDDTDQPADRSPMYALLYESYASYMQAYVSAPRGAEGYVQARKALTELHPHLQNGAAWYSRSNDSEATREATRFARAYVELILDHDMQDVPDMRAEACAYFPTMVYFAAANTFNAGNYKAAVRYFSEYLKTGETSRRDHAMQLLATARNFLRDAVKRNGVPPADTAGIARPEYMDYLNAYVTPRMEQWRQKNQFESTRDYNARMDTATAQLQHFYRDGTQEYAERFSQPFTPEEMVLEDYDADNQVFPIMTPYGEVFLPVPRTNNEAQEFAQQWGDVRIKNPAYGMVFDSFALSQLTFMLPSGMEYRYDVAQLPKRTPAAEVPRDTPPQAVGSMATGDARELLSANVQAPVATVPRSDVDMGIPHGRGKSDNTFAVIISNEDYKYVPKVEMASNDGAVFAKYCERTLGIDPEHIRSYTNASYGEISMAVSDIQRIARGMAGDINILFYYAGHGLPNRASQDAYLLPIDSDGKNTDACYPLSRLYAELSATDARQVVVMLDACFSGASLEEKGRGKIIVKPKAEKPQGNMVVFSAASGEQIAHPYMEQSHGLFTYYLLKKLKESKGRVSLKELQAYIESKVTAHASVRLHEEQTPTVNVSPTCQASWERMRLVP